MSVTILFFNLQTFNINLNTQLFQWADNKLINEY